MCQQHLLYVAIVSSQALALSAGTLIQIRGQKRQNRWASTLYKKKKPNEKTVRSLKGELLSGSSMQFRRCGHRIVKNINLIKDKRK
jgi:hypothetical protein